MLSRKSIAYEYFAGFSLIELMVTLAVLATLVAVATPYVTGVIANNKVETEANRLVSALNIARSSALKLKRPIGFCRSESAASCDPGDDWSGVGWLIFEDDDRDSELDAGEKIRRFQEGRQDVEVSYIQAAEDVLLPDRIMFNSQGSLVNPIRITAYTLLAPNCYSNGSRQIVVLASGATQVSKVACP